ncbi:TonB-dependent receptor-like protein [Algoriphagus boseongensis]|uniref:TonB-dependent receptor-like protein n=1 Tax=Algoriphagus boseongensis TaxID=1442587 RepID=A0A4R6T8Q8_9BACT|nr:TonB-dependent receptor [Algoriphagus boseongensis]TDQ19101.1 TonB-dependent receptor-like protein [Algoriphagus boseongensis]
MRNFTSKIWCSVLTLAFLVSFGTSSVFAQTTISGTVTDKETKETLVGVNIVVKGKVIGTITDLSGKFTLNVNQEPPFTLIFSMVGYTSTEVEVTGGASNISVELEESSIMGQEVVISASRVEENIMKSPVSIEKMDIIAIRETPSATFYDALNNLKGVDMMTQSLTFRSVNTRGFGSNGNVRMVQLIDGMDNQAPGLNFSVGNIVGISELDLESVELIPGAASALYGPNALTGLLLMNSKSPFQYQGLSAYAKTGLMNEEGRVDNNGDKLGATGFYDVGIRYAKSIGNKFAYKINLSYLKAQDWQANDFRDQSLLNGNGLNDGSHANNIGYNGVNSYGDETNVNMYNSLFANGQPGTGAGGTSPFLGFIATNQIQTPLGRFTLPQLTGQTPQQLFNQMIPGSTVTNISRIGYLERDLADYNTKSFKGNLALHYRFNDKIEGILQGNYGTGTSVYTGADRYALKDFYLYQIKAELRGDNFFLRAYTTQERSGDAFAIGTTAALVNEAWKPSTTWYPQYFTTFGGGSYQIYATAYLTAISQGATPAQAQAAATAAVNSNVGNLHGAARGVADSSTGSPVGLGRADVQPGSEAFNNIVSQVKENPIPRGGRFVDKSNMYHYEGMYNFKNEIKFAEVLIGGNYRVYDLNSEGTLFALDENGEEQKITEFGGYVQAAKSLINDKLKLTGSLRYDKNVNFKGQWSPRVSGVYSAGNHNFRASYQTGFRIPTTQDQYIDLATPQARLIGGLPFFRDKYDLVGKSYTLESVLAGSPKLYEFTEFKPERAVVYEFGYKTLIGQRMLVDASLYNTTYENFIAGQVIVKPTGPATREVYSLPTNLDEKIKAFGWALGLDYKLAKSFNLGGNIAYNKLNDNAGLSNEQIAFNTPEFRYNVSFGYRDSKKKLGFNVVWRYQDSYLWQSSFVGPAVRVTEQSVMPSFSTLDAQLNYKLKSIKSIVKIGGTNILNQSYQSNWGNPTIGAMYYISITFDEFLN